MNSDTTRRLYNRFNIKKACSFLFVKYSGIDLMIIFGGSIVLSAVVLLLLKFALKFNHVVLFGLIVLVYRYR